MNTQLLKADSGAIREAARLLKSGSLVAFPTETVYGLGANALDPGAVAGIFTAKGRPADNPLIMHIWHSDQLDGLCETPPLARELMDAFWPGPLTLLMPRTPRVPDIVTASLPTVAVRMPSHPVAAALLQACGVPVAAPSANRSGKPSPTTAAHVLADMAGRIPLILDGGPCQVGLESTVLDTCHGIPTILRPGGITKEMLEAVIGEVQVASSVLQPLRPGEKALSPGMRYRHYAPEGEITLVEGAEEQVLAALQTLCRDAEQAGHRPCVLCFSQHVDSLSGCHPHDLGGMEDAETVAHRLFDVLRTLDSEPYDVIFSEVLPPEGVGLAVMNRLGRAASFRTVQAEDIL